METEYSLDAQPDDAGAPKEYNASDIIELAKKIERGDSEAFQEMITANTGLVANIAAEFTGNGMEYDDLCQEGFIGLLRAIEKFDWRRGNAFSTYAAFWIRQAISWALVGAPTIKVPSKLGVNSRHVHRTQNQLLVSSGQSPTVDRLSEETGIKPEVVRTILNIPKADISLNQPLSDSADGDDLSTSLADPEAKNPLDILISADQTAIDGMLSVLTERQRMVMELRFGLNGQMQINQKQIGEKMQLSGERVRQIIEKSKRKILRHLESQDQSTKDRPKAKQPEREWEELAGKLSLTEVEVLEMSLEGFTDSTIGHEVGIGGHKEAKAIKLELAIRFNLTLDELMLRAPQIIQVALMRGEIPE